MDASFPFPGFDKNWNGSAFQRWITLEMEASKVMGKDCHRVPRYKTYLKKIGFVNVVERRLSV